VGNNLLMEQARCLSFHLKNRKKKEKEGGGGDSFVYLFNLYPIDATLFSYFLFVKA
jgi:hypothetical protein